MHSLQLDDAALEAFERRLGYAFVDRRLIATALTHASIAHDLGDHNHYERLEFLGDAVLGLVTAHWLFELRPGAPEGELSRLKSYLVSAPVLAQYAENLGLGELLLMSAGEEKSGGRGKPSLLADSLEAVFAAVFLDGGLEAVRGVLLPYLERANAEAPDLTLQDAKTHLQERLQAAGQPLPSYQVVEVSGPDHDKRFVIECWIGEEVAGQGEGRSKKGAEQEAASEALRTLGFA